MMNVQSFKLVITKSELKIVAYIASNAPIIVERFVDQHTFSD